MDYVEINKHTGERTVLTVHNDPEEADAHARYLRWREYSGSSARQVRPKQWCVVIPCAFEKHASLVLQRVNDLGFQATVEER